LWLCLEIELPVFRWLQFSVGTPKLSLCDVLTARRSIHTVSVAVTAVSSPSPLHCNHNFSSSFPSYRLAYPFSSLESTVAYKIDKCIGSFVALGAKAVESEVESPEKALDRLNLDMSRSLDGKIWKQATEMITIGIEDETFRRLHQVFGGKIPLP
jgi:hypothetical protein